MSIMIKSKVHWLKLGQRGEILLFIHPEGSVLKAFHLIKKAGAMFVLYYIEAVFVTFYLQQPKQCMAHQHHNQQISFLKTTVILISIIH